MIPARPPWSRVGRRAPCWECARGHSDDVGRGPEPEENGEGGGGAGHHQLAAQALGAAVDAHDGAAPGVPGRVAAEELLGVGLVPRLVRVVAARGRHVQAGHAAVTRQELRVAPAPSPVRPRRRSQVRPAVKMPRSQSSAVLRPRFSRGSARGSQGSASAPPASSPTGGSDPRAEVF